jgi:hypothetical protein
MWMLVTVVLWILVALVWAWIRWADAGRQLDWMILQGRLQSSEEEEKT